VVLSMYTVVLHWDVHVTFGCIRSKSLKSDHLNELKATINYFLGGGGGGAV